MSKMENELTETLWGCWNGDAINEIQQKLCVVFPGELSALITSMLVFDPQVGDKVLCRDRMGVLLPAVIISPLTIHHKMRVHFIRWSPRYDEEVWAGNVSPFVWTKSIQGSARGGRLVKQRVGCQDLRLTLHKLGYKWDQVELALVSRDYPSLTQALDYIHDDDCETLFWDDE